MAEKIVSILKARPPERGIISVQNAALYLRATRPPAPPGDPIPIWRKPPPSFAGPSTRHLYRWVASWAEMHWHDEEDRDFLNFLDLVRLRMIFLMRTRGLPPSLIRSAEYHAIALTGSPCPFATEKLWTTGSDVFLELAEYIVSIARYPQLPFPELIRALDPLDHGLAFDPSDERAVLWQPRPGVLIDPSVQFGSPCIEGTRIETDVIWSLNRGGQTPAALAEMYGVSRTKIDAAIAWERDLAEVS